MTVLAALIAVQAVTLAGLVLLAIRHRAQGRRITAHCEALTDVFEATSAGVTSPAPARHLRVAR